MASQSSSGQPRRLSGLDWFFVVSFVVFGVTPFLFEPAVVFGCGGDGGLAVCAQKYQRTGSLWYGPAALFHWYAESFDPVFLYTPDWLAWMCCLDMVVFGPCYVALTYVHRGNSEPYRVPHLHSVTWCAVGES